MRLATNNDNLKEHLCELYRKGKGENTRFLIIYDLIVDYNQEFVTDEIATLINLLSMPRLGKSPYLPEFSGMKKNG